MTNPATKSRPARVFVEVKSDALLWYMQKPLWYRAVKTTYRMPASFAARARASASSWRGSSASASLAYSAGGMRSRNVSHSPRSRSV